MSAIRQTDVVSFVENNDGVLGHLFRNLFRDLGIKQVMEGIYYDIDEWHLEHCVSASFVK